MKKYKAEIKTNCSEDWDADAIQEHIEAESVAEAEELAKQYLIDCCVQDGNDPDPIEEWEIRVKEV